MFHWTVRPNAKPFPVEELLDKEHFTLEDLLEEDDTVQVLAPTQAPVPVLSGPAWQLAACHIRAGSSQDR